MRNAQPTSTAADRRSGLLACLLACLLAVLSAALPGLALAAATPEEYVPGRRARGPHNDITYVLAPAETSGAAAVDLLAAIRDDGRALRFTWDADGYRLSAFPDAGATPIISGDRPFPAALADGGTVVLRSRPHWFDVIVSGERLARIATETVTRGGTAFGRGPGLVPCSETRVQRVEPVVFGDDFMRTEEEGRDLGLWERIAGTWKMHSVMDDVRANPDARIREGREPVADRVVNPFSLEGMADDEGIVLNGYPFWNDYRLAVSAKSLGSSFGLVFNVADKDNLWVLRWRLRSHALRNGALELVQRSGGTDRVVAQASVPGCIDNWYRLQLETYGSRIRAAVDGVHVLQADDDASTGGRIGLYVAGTNPTFFDDLSLTSVSAFHTWDRTSLGQQAAALAGTWDVTTTTSGLQFAAGDGTCLYRLGDDSWPAMCTTASLDLGGADAIGLAFAVGSADTFGLARLRAADDGNVVELLRVNGTEEALLRRTPYTPSPDGTPETMDLDLREPGIVQVRLDGDLAIREKTDAPLAGPVGLYTQGAATFARVTAFTEPHEEWERPVNVERFANDPYMQGWASPRYAWLRTERDKDDYPRRYVHKGDFYGAFELTMPIGRDCSLFFGRDQLDPEQSYRLRATVEDGRGHIAISRAGKLLAGAGFTPAEKSTIPGQQIVDEKIGALPRTPDTLRYGDLVVHRDGNLIWATVNGAEVLNVHDDQPLTGRTLGLEIADPTDFLHVQVVRNHVRDYLFEEAPVDWTAVGTWEVTNRFACDPRWSHLNGRSKGLAALWNKLEFDGDLTVEYYAGMRMRQGDMHEGAERMYYPRVGDINLALPSKADDLFSGYNVIFAAWETYWNERYTRLLRENEVLAQTDRELLPKSRGHRAQTRVIDVEWDPGGRPIHGAWYFVKMRKTGARLDVSFDNVPVFSVDDPDAISTRHLALWTQHNSIVIARAKVGYRRCRPGLPGAIPLPPEAVPPVAAPPRLTVSSHPAASYTFDAGHAEGLTSLPGDQNVDLRLVPHGDGKALRLENCHAGGSMAAALPWEGWPIDRVATLSFDCRIPSETKVNLYVQFDDDPLEYGFVQLSGPSDPGPNLVRIGQFETTESREDGWRTVSIPLGEAVRAAFPWRGSYVVRRVVLGMLHEGYLNAGQGGNPAGARWFLDNLTVTSLGPLTVDLSVAGRHPDTPWRCRIRAIDENTPPPPYKEADTDIRKRLTAPAAGTWVVNGEYRQGDHWHACPPVSIEAAAPLTVAKTAPAADGAWGGTPLRIAFEGPAGIHPHLPSIRLEVGKTKAVLNNASLAYEAKTRTLTVQPTAFNEGIDNGTDVPLTLTWVDSLSPRTEDDDAKPKTHSWTTRYDWSLDATAPTRVTVAECPVLDFETGLEGLLPASEPTMVRFDRIPRDDATGGHALRVTNRVCGSTFAANVDLALGKLGDAPLLSFDYRTDGQARADLRLESTGTKKTIGFTDCDPGRNSSPNYLGPVEGIVADGQWRSATVDLYAMLTANDRRRYPYSGKLGALAMGDWGYAGNAPGVHHDLDNIRLIPVLNLDDAEKLTFASRDPSGIAGYSWTWDTAADTEPDRTMDDPDAPPLPEADTEGATHLHVRAVDRAGNWGPASHCPVLFDNEPPRIAGVSPAPNTRAAVGSVSLRFADGVAGLDLSKARLVVNGVNCRLGSGARWDAERNELSVAFSTAWRTASTTPEDGSELRAVLTGVTDYAGNRAPPFEWSWILDYSLDTTPPELPRLYSGGTRTFDHFSEGVGSWRGLRKSRADGQTAIETVMDPDRGNECLVIEGGSARFGAYRTLSGNSAASQGTLVFDYRIDPGMRVSLLLYADKTWQAVAMTADDEHDLPMLGRVEGARDDGQWRQARIDLSALLPITETEGKPTVPRLSMCAFGSWGHADNDGRRMYIDNVALLKTDPPAPIIAFYGSDPTGIHQYHVGFSQDLNGTPDTTVGSKSRRFIPGVASTPGIWYCHARAEDGAGNTSELIHYPFLIAADLSAAGHANGLEAGERWLARNIRRRSYVPLETVTGTDANTVAVMQFTSTARGKIQLSRAWTGKLNPGAALTATLLLTDRDACKVAACVRAADGRRLLTTEAVTLEPGNGPQSVRFEWTEEQLADAEEPPDDIEVNRIGFVVTPGRRSRGALLLDKVEFHTAN